MNMLIHKWTCSSINEHVHTQMNMFIHKWTCSYANEHVHTQMNIVRYFFMPHVMHLNIQWTFIMRHVRVFLNMQHKKNIIYQFWQVHMKITLSSFTSCLDMQDIYLVKVFFPHHAQFRFIMRFKLNELTPACICWLSINWMKCCRFFNS